MVLGSWVSFKCEIRMLPGSAIKASACFAISDFLWCMSVTVFTSPCVCPDICNGWVHLAIQYSFHKESLTNKNDLTDTVTYLMRKKRSRDNPKERRE